jgi:hypothetical protein
VFGATLADSVSDWANERLDSYEPAGNPVVP